MARKVHGGIVGGSGLGGLSATDTTITARENDNIVFDPTGTGVLQIDGNTELLRQSALRFADLDSSNYVAFQSPTTVTSNVTWTLPAEDGAVTQALVTNGAGVLSWAAAGATVSDQTVSASTFYPLFFNATTGTASAVNVASSKLTFQPSTGILTVTGISGYASAVTLTADNTTNATNYPLFSNSATGDVSPRTDTGYTYNPSSGTLTAVILTASSDVRTKENVVTIEDALNKTLSLRGVMFNRIGSATNELGVIAQEVEAIVPELVITDENDMKSVAYGNALGLLIESIKSLNDKIEDLRGRLA